MNRNGDEEMGVKIGHRKKIISLLEKWKPQKYGSRSSTVGILESDWEEENKVSENPENNNDLDGLIVRLSGLTALQTIAEGESVDVDAYLALISKQIEKDFNLK